MRFRDRGRRVRSNTLVAYPNDTPGRPARFPTAGQARAAIRRTLRHFPVGGAGYEIVPAWPRNEEEIQHRIASQAAFILAQLGIGPVELVETRAN
jgi:hypothetical protein